MAFNFKITTTKEAAQHHGIKVCVYGGAGAGKTRLCATCTPEDHNKTLIISVESGLLSLRGVEVPVVQVSSFSEMEEIYQYLKAGDHGFEWVCLDSISEIAEQCLKHYKEVHGESANGWAVYGSLFTEMDSLLKKFRDLPMNVYMSAKMERDKTDDGALLYLPMMPGNKLTAQLPFLFDEMFCLHSFPEETDEGVVVHRKLQTFRDARYECKDRSGALDPWENASLSHIANKINSSMES